MINTLETLEFNKVFDRLASDEQIVRTMQALESNGIHTVVFETGEQARQYVMSLIPAGVQVYNPPSRTVDQIGLRAEIESSPSFQSLHSRLHSLDRVTQRAEMRKLISSPDVVIGSVHAITERGEVLIASASGSQLSSTASGADKVIWVVGTQKLVATLEEGFRRIREYSYPLENSRAQQVYGRPSAINKILIIRGELPGRITMILVKENLGF
ncbi:MAG TPA: LUD domain-containing protein [Anaerolineales bacterium]|nr:LUD domain-containing protein [Anaerolineales bacterium]